MYMYEFSMKLLTSEHLAKSIKAVVLIGLIIIFGLFIQEVWAKFTERATNSRQSFKIVDTYEFPTITVCFTPSIKPSMKKNYNLSGLDWNNLVASNSSIKSMAKMFKESYYHYGRDFHFTILNYKFEPVELHEDTENVFEYPKGTLNRIIVSKFQSYIYGLCYSITPSFFQNPDIFYSLGIVLSDSLKQKRDEPKKVNIMFTSNSNAYGIVRGTWVEGDQLEMSLSLEERGVIANLRENRYHLLSSPPHCQKISHYKCLGYGLVKVMENEKFCAISTPYGSMCVNECPRVCLPPVFQNLVELVILNITTPICETGEENRCMATIMHFHLVDFAKHCSSSCTLIKYTGAESGTLVIIIQLS